MKKLQKLFNKIDKYIDEQENNDFHCIPLVMVSCALVGRINTIKEKKTIIQTYFKQSPDVYNIVKNYRIGKLIKFLERIIRIKQSIAL